VVFGILGTYLEYTQNKKEKNNFSSLFFIIYIYICEIFLIETKNKKRARAQEKGRERKKST